jgi:cobaltochelatase CobS
MHVVERRVEDIFLALKGKGVLSNLLLPLGEYDENLEEDQRLKTLVPEFDSQYRFPGKLLNQLIIAMHNRHNVLFYGPTGTGKTMLPMMFCAQLQLPLTRINFDGEIGRPELIGYWGLANPNDPEDDGYKVPALIRGIQRPGMLLLDEWDTARPEASLCLQRLLEDYNPGVFLVEKDQFVPKHKDCIVVATANTRGLGDEQGLYAGTQNQNFAQLNRFHMVIEVEPLTAANVEVILKNQLINGKPLQVDVLNAMVKFYDAVRSAYMAHTITAPLSIRSIVHFAKYYMLLEGHALRLVVLDKLPTNQDKIVVQQLAERLKLAAPTSSSS